MPILFALFRHQLSLLRSRLALIRSEKRWRKGSVHRRIGRGKGGPQSSTTTIQGKTRGERALHFLFLVQSWDGRERGEGKCGQSLCGRIRWPFSFFPLGCEREGPTDRPMDGLTVMLFVCPSPPPPPTSSSSSSSPLHFPPISRSLWRPRGLIRFPSAPCLLFSFSFSHAITQLSPSLPRAAQQEEEGPRAGAQEEVQEELGLLGLREEGALHHKEDHQEAVVLLVRHHARLLQHLLGGRGALRAAGLAFRILA